MKLTEELITEISESVSTGLSNRDAALLSNIDNSTFYRWLRKAKKAADKPASKISQHARLCKQFKVSIEKAKLTRKKRWIQKIRGVYVPYRYNFLAETESSGGIQQRAGPDTEL